MSLHKMSGMAWILTVILCFATTGAWGADNPRQTPVVRAVQKVAPAVVNITSDRVVEKRVNPFGTLFGDERWGGFFDDIPGMDQTRKYRYQSLGSGVIIDGEKGLVLSNAHVVDAAGSITVRLKDGRELKANVVGADPDFDLAVLKVDTKEKLPRVRMGDSGDIMIGETVIAIGNPYGYTHTVTTGVVSAMHRSIKTEHGTFTDFIQTDAAINPGNSGGPLLNIMGELIGINTAIHASAEGIGFAIPINKARRVVAELLSRGKVSPVWLGLMGQDLDQRTARYFGLENTHGMLIAQVFKDSPAREKDIRPGDVLLSVDGVRIQDKDHFIDLLRNYTKGAKLRLELKRRDKPYSVSIRARELPDNQALVLAAFRWGIYPADRQRGGGLLVGKVKSGSAADRLGLKPGDVITRIGNMELGGQDDFIHSVLRYRMSNSLLVQVVRRGRMYYAKMIL